jgi:hypothetical protein
MGIRLLRGRDIAASDREGTPGVVVINATMARKYWPNDDPIGRQIRIGDVAKGPVATIIGVVADARYQTLESEDSRPMMYFSWHAAPQQSMTVVARTRVTDSGGASRGARDQDRRLPAPTLTPFGQAAMGNSSLRSRYRSSRRAPGAGRDRPYGVASSEAADPRIRRARVTRARLLMLVVSGALRLTVVGVILPPTG